MTMTVEPPPVDRLDAGVIEDARARQRRHRSVGAAAALALAIAGLVAYSAGGSGGVADRGSLAHGRPPAVAPTPAGAVTAVSLRSGYRLVTGPNLGGIRLGTSGLCLTVYIPDGRSDGMCGIPYPRAGYPIVEAPEWGLRVSGGRVFVLLAAHDVATVRVGELAVITAQAVPGLPPGDHAIAFRLNAATAGRVIPLSWTTTPPVSLVAYDSAGHPIPFDQTTKNQVWGGSSPAVFDSPTPPGRCAVAFSLPGQFFTLVGYFNVSTIVAQAAAGPDELMSCLSNGYRLATPYDNTYLTVAVLLDARAPGHRPPPIWDATPLAGHPGIVKATAQASYNEAFVARRVGNAWLVVTIAQATTLSQAAALKQSLEVLAATRITRLELSHR